MRRSSMITGLMALGLLVAGCGDSVDGDTAAPTDDTAEAAATDDEGGDDEDAGEEDDGSATVTWDGETYEYDSASCRTSMSRERFQMLARGGDNPQLDVRFDADGDSGDFTQPPSLELFFDRGETIGDGEGYEASRDDTGALTADESGVSGTVDLEPDTQTQAPELNPEGGTLEFELVCPA